MRTIPGISRCMIGLLIPLALLLTACAGTGSGSAGPQEVKIAERWSGDYPVTALEGLPLGQRDTAVGWLDHDSFAAVWTQLRPQNDAAVPTVDFERNLVVFVRNTAFYNRTNIFRVTLLNGVAEVLAMETMSAMPVEDRVAMALAVVPRAGIRAVRVGGTIVPVSPDR